MHPKQNSKHCRSPATKRCARYACPPTPWSSWTRRTVSFAPIAGTNTRPKRVTFARIAWRWRMSEDEYYHREMDAAELEDYRQQRAFEDYQADQAVQMHDRIEEAKKIV